MMSWPMKFWRWTIQPAHLSRRGMIVLWLGWACIGFSTTCRMRWEAWSPLWNTTVDEERFIWEGGPKRSVFAVPGPWRMDVAGYLAAWPLGLIAAALWHGLVRFEARARRWNRGQCWNCGFDLCGMTTPTCPECGIDTQRMPRPPRSRQTAQSPWS